MKKYLISAVAIFAVLALVVSVSGQPAGGGGGGRGAGGGFGGQGGGMGMGAGMGGRGGMRRAVERPDRAARLDAIKQLETQIAALKAAIEKAPAADPNIATLEGEALTKFMDVYTPESDAINAIQQTLSTLRGGGGARGGRGGGGASEDVLSELRVLADKEKATKTVARLDALIKEAQNRTNRRGAGGGQFGGGQGGGRGQSQQ